jgi:hypothetical protein
MDPEDGLKNALKVPENTDRSSPISEGDAMF